MKIKKISESQKQQGTLLKNLQYLKLPFMMENHKSLGQQAAQNQWTHLDFLEKLIQGESDLRSDTSIQRRIRSARFPVIKTLDQFQWSWPKKINRLQAQNLFGLGKTHLASALGYTACLEGNTVLFSTAIDVINTLSAAQKQGRLKQELNKYTRPSLLILDEL